MKFRVTITAKYPAWYSKPWTMDVEAKNKSDANKRARVLAEADGHRFTGEDQATFRAEPLEDKNAVL